MEISYLGANSFRLKGKTAVVVADPGKKVDADVVVLTDNGEYKGESFVVNGPGEYEVKGVSVVGVNDRGKTVYVIEVDGLRVVCGCLEEKLTQDQLTDLGPIDIVTVGSGTIKADVVRQLDPWVILVVSGRYKEFGSVVVEPVAKYSVTAEKLPSELLVVGLESK